MVSILQVTPWATSIQNVPQLALDTHFTRNIHNITIPNRGPFRNCLTSRLSVANPACPIAIARPRLAFPVFILVVTGDALFTEYLERRKCRLLFETVLESDILFITGSHCSVFLWLDPHIVTHADLLIPNFFIMDTIAVGSVGLFRFWYRDQCLLPERGGLPLEN